MPNTILRILWPYILRYLAERVVEYLDKRREEKRQLKQATQAAEAEAIAAGEIAAYPEPQTKHFSAGVVWYTLGGLLVGSVLGLIVANILRKER